MQARLILAIALMFAGRAGARLPDGAVRPQPADRRAAYAGDAHVAPESSTSRRRHAVYSDLAAQGIGVAAVVYDLRHGVRQPADRRRARTPATHPHLSRPGTG